MRPVRERTADHGFTLAETLVALAILVVVGISATALVINLLRTSRATQLRITATNLAQQDLQRMRAINDPSTSSAIVSATLLQVVGGTSYTIARTVTSSATPCVSGGYRTVTTTVTPTNSTRAVTLATRLAC